MSMKYRNKMNTTKKKKEKNDNYKHSNVKMQKFKFNKINSNPHSSRNNEFGRVPQLDMSIS